MRSRAPQPLVLRDGALAFQRLGSLAAPKRRHVRRHSIRIPPERRGLWAFPFGYFDMYYAVHKFEEVLPKALRRDAIVAAGNDEGWTARRDAWVAAHGAEVLPLRTFWVDGPVWSRIPPSGRLDDAGIGPEDWHLIPLERYVHSARRLVKYGFVPALGGTIAYARPSDLLEVFVPLRHACR